MPAKWKRKQTKMNLVFGVRRCKPPVIVPYGREFVACHQLIRGWPFPDPKPPSKLDTVISSSDYYLLWLMDTEQISPLDFQSDIKRFQHIRTSGSFHCQNFTQHPTNSSYHWSSKDVWILFDLFDQSVAIFGQKCRLCGTKSAFLQPNKYSKEKWEKICCQALSGANNAITQSSNPILDEDDLKELSSLCSRRPHVMALCEKCHLLEGPCWIPHKSSDCQRCQMSTAKCCFNPSKYLRSALIISVHNLTKAKPSKLERQYFTFTNQPKIMT